MKIIVPITNRTNYTKLKPVLFELKSRDIYVVCAPSSGIAVERTGSGLNDIMDDGFDLSHSIDCLMMNDTLESMGKTMGLSMIEHVSLYAREKPDKVLIVGDRFDMLPAAIAAKVMNLSIVHIQGGERSGSIDDTVRDLITTCSEKHYVSTDQSADIVSRIKGSSDGVFNFGCPGVEYISSIEVGEYLDTTNFHKRFKDNFDIQAYDEYVLVMVHPNTIHDQDVDMIALLNAVVSFNMKIVIIYPNIDAYHNRILDAIRVYHDKMICIKHMPVEDFITVMAHAKCMVGNSSSGIREAALFGTPVVNVGNRQKNRERNINTIDSDKHYNNIVDAISKSLKVGRYEVDNIYYKPECVKNICNNILEAD